MQTSVNKQISTLKESATLEINQLALNLKNKGENIYHLGFGESPFPIPEAMQNALSQNVHQKNYISGNGLPKLKHVIAKFFKKEFGYKYSSENIFIGPGSKELIFQLVYMLEGPLMVPAPSWVSYGPHAHIRSKKFITINTDIKNSYRLQASELEKICKSQSSIQKILILNNPSNPTGSIHTPQELMDISEVCRKHGVIVISDEIYSLINFRDTSFHGIAKYYPEGTITTSGVSKAFSAGGWRLGFAMLPNELNKIGKPLTAFISETFSCVSAPIQYGVIPAFERYELVKNHVELCRDIHHAASIFLYNKFKEIGLNCPKPEGAFYLFPDFENFRNTLNNRGIYTSDELCKSLLKEAKVALLPGSNFYMTENFLAVRVASVDYNGKKVLKDFPRNRKISEEICLKIFPNLSKACDNIGAWLKE